MTTLGTRTVLDLFIIIIKGHPRGRHTLLHARLHNNFCELAHAQKSGDPGDPGAPVCTLSPLQVMQL